MNEDDPDNEDDEEVDSDDESSSSSDEEEEVHDTNPPRKSRILKAFEDSDDEAESEKLQNEPNSDVLFTTEDLLDDQRNSEFTQNTQMSSLGFLDTQSSFKMPSVSENMLSNRIDNLFDPKPTQTIEEDDLMDICSGQFAPTQSDKKIDGNQIENDDLDDFVSQVPERNEEYNISANIQLSTDDLDDDFVTQVETQNFMQRSDNLEENSANQLVSQIETETPDLLFSNEIYKEIEIETGNIQKTENIQIDPKKLLESSDDEVEAVEISEKRKKKLKKRRKKKNLKLGFSDDEDESVDEDLEIEEEDEEEILDEEEAADVCIDYDSEENEIEVKMTKKEKMMKASNYFENEAEMSESEWGSADEDERGMDKYDIEVADEEEFDQNKLREEVGMIHARKVLDDDIRKLKKLQDALIQDEDDGEGRERQFKWKNQTNGFDVNDENAMDPHDAGSESEDESQREIEWRKQRHERETFLREISQSQIHDKKQPDNSINELSNSCSSRPSDPVKVVKKLDSSSCFSSPHFLINTEENMKRYKSSSYLARGADTLKRIAKFVSYKDDEITMSSTGNSMSFVMLDKPDESKKRKSDGKQPENSKRLKLEKKSTLSSSLLDQLK